MIVSLNPDQAAQELVLVEPTLQSRFEGYVRSHPRLQHRMIELDMEEAIKFLNYLRNRRGLDVHELAEKRGRIAEMLDKSSILINARNAVMIAQEPDDIGYVKRDGWVSVLVCLGVPQEFHEDCKAPAEFDFELATGHMSWKLQVALNHMSAMMVPLELRVATLTYQQGVIDSLVRLVENHHFSMVCGATPPVGRRTNRARIQASPVGTEQPPAPPGHAVVSAFALTPPAVEAATRPHPQGSLAKRAVQRRSRREPACRRRLW